MASVWCAHCVRMACKSPFSQYYMPHRVPYLYALYTYVFYACHLCMSYMYTVISSSPYYSSALPSCSLALPSSRSPTRPHFRSKSFPSPSTAQTHAHTHARAHTHLILKFPFNNQAAGRICSCVHTPTISQHAAKCECACMSVCDVCMHVQVHKHTRTCTPHAQASTRARTPTHPPTHTTSQTRQHLDFPGEYAKRLPPLPHHSLQLAPQKKGHHRWHRSPLARRFQHLVQIPSAEPSPASFLLVSSPWPPPPPPPPRLPQRLPLLGGCLRDYHRATSPGSGVKAEGAG